MANQFPNQPQTPAFSLPFRQATPQAGNAANAEFSEHISNLSGRMKLVEERIDSLRGHIDIIDNSLMEKHKAVISELREVEDSVRSMRGDLEEVKSLVERLAKRLEELASREEVKILERYVSMWQPMNFVTRNEVAAVVKSILSESGVKLKEEK